MSKVFAILSLVAVSILGGATPALAHQHINPSGTCPADSANVLQGFDNPGNQTPGGRNNAFGNEQGTANCQGS